VSVSPFDAASCRDVWIAALSSRLSSAIACHPAVPSHTPPVAGKVLLDCAGGGGGGGGDVDIAGDDVPPPPPQDTATSPMSVMIPV